MLIRVFYLSMQLQASVSAIVGQVPKKSPFGYLLCVLLLNSCYGHWTKWRISKKLKWWAGEAILPSSWEKFQQTPKLKITDKQLITV